MDVQTIDVSAEAHVERYRQVRAFSERLCEPLQTEDYVVQTMPDVSPTKWHLAHTTWFFETFVLQRIAGREPYDPAYGYLFNSYYNGVGEQFPRSRRGELTRPTVADVYSYRSAVDEALVAYLAGLDVVSAELARVMTIGLHHEQQHQELLLTDLKHVLAQNPLRPAYRADIGPDLTRASRAGSAGSDSAPETGTRASTSSGLAASPGGWLRFEEGVHEFGHAGEGFAYDNESPRHRQLVHPFELATRPVTNREYLGFIEAGGYDDPAHWLSEGWATVQEQGWRAPLYWERRREQHGEGWWRFTLGGMRPVDPDAPVTHLSLFEADAYAAWAGARLPSELEWELAARTLGPRAIAEGNFVESEIIDPRAREGSERPGSPAHGEAPVQMFGDVWEWTRSAYGPYPEYHPADGALGEYNGKFMCNQYVLRGGSCATSRTHIRATYRNFFPAHTRWQFTGLRLARDPR